MPLELAVHHVQAGEERHVVLQLGERLQGRGELPVVAATGREEFVRVIAVAIEKDPERGRQRFTLGEGRAVIVAHGIQDRQPERHTDAAHRTLQGEPTRNTQLF